MPSFAITEIHVSEMFAETIGETIGETIEETWMRVSNDVTIAGSVIDRWMIDRSMIDRSMTGLHVVVICYDHGLDVGMYGVAACRCDMNRRSNE